MDDQRTLRRIQSAPDAVVRQEYISEGGRKRLDHVVWSSALLGMEQRVDIPRIDPVTGGRKRAEQKLDEGQNPSGTHDPIEPKLMDGNRESVVRDKRERKD